MGQRNTDTAVLIFSLSARREAERKALFGHGKKQSTNVFFDILIKQTKKLAAASGVDAFFIDERQQQGQSFGERYANAFQEIFDLGYTKVVSIGNDAPDLTVDTLRKAIAEIQHKDLIVGPSTDGGVYLLGLGHSLFNADEFLNLPWLQDTLCDTLSHSIYWQQGGSFSLGMLSDVDDTASLLQFMKTTSDRSLAEFILSHLLLSKAGYGHLTVVTDFGTYISALSLRGPPSLLIHIKSIRSAA